MSSNPLLSIWLHPRATVRDLKENGSSNDVLIFAALSGIASSLDNASNRNSCDSYPLGLMLILAATVGPIGGLITVWLGSMLISFTGDFLKGRARIHEIRLALAWGLFPKTVSLIPWAVVIATTGPMLFQSKEVDFEGQPLGVSIALLAALIVIFIFNLWAIFTTCHALAEVQGFNSAWKAFLNVVLAFLLIVLPFVLLIVAIVLLR
jgi:Yip1 domain